MFWKNNMRSINFSYSEFLQKEFVKVINKFNVGQKLCPRGIPLKKKEDILKKLCPMMEKNRQVFWNNLPVAEVPDLIDEYDDE